MTWTAPTIERRPRTNMADTELATLRDFLYRQRTYLLMKCAGLTAGQLKTASAPPSSLTLLGLVRHMAEIERFWFRVKYGQLDLPDIYSTPELEGGDFGLVADADPEADFATLLAEQEAADAVTAGRDLAEPVADDGAPTGQVNLRWVYLHVIEEYAQHNGHADVIRERLDRS
ncbi:DinB family protein [Longispora albida]|uniref:DinB family protein n=1 Tax=Longispora albida TaxID=203523 RepID=UPI000382514D|nr:DinB family protein [Longispora albida]